MYTVTYRTCSRSYPTLHEALTDVRRAYPGCYTFSDDGRQIWRADDAITRALDARPGAHIRCWVDEDAPGSYWKQVVATIRCAAHVPPPDADMTRVRTLRTCSWCHAANASTVRWCATCGHAAHLPRLQCDCPQCQPALETDGAQGA
jgi:hypothetical protein